MLFSKMLNVPLGPLEAEAKAFEEGVLFIFSIFINLMALAVQLAIDVV